MIAPTETPALRTFHDLDEETRMRELTDFHRALIRPPAPPIDALGLRNWVSNSDARLALTKGLVCGGIKWSKEMGRPNGSSITVGFLITHEYDQLEYNDAGGGAFTKASGFQLRPAPTVWDATTNQNEYRVAFMFFAVDGGVIPNRLTVKLAPVSWEGSSITAGYRKLDPVAYSSFGNLGQSLVIPDFEVKRIAFPLGKYVLSLGSSVSATLRE
jgi:hypothetical protein